MTGRLRQRLSALERRSDPLAAWRGVPAADVPDRVLLALIAAAEGWPAGHEPTDAELRAIASAGSGRA